jgi:hypothetical protein
MSLDDKIAAKVEQLIIRGEIDPSKVKEIEKRVGVKLKLSTEQLAIAALVYTNRQEYIKCKG